MYNKGTFDSNQHTNHKSGWCRDDFRSRFGDAFSGAPWGKHVHRKLAGHKSVNIEDAGECYVLSLYAAGLKKELFSLSVKDDVLTISYQPAGSPESSPKYIHEEYQPVSFQRSFLLNGKVLTDNITASYLDGVLKVSLPKNPDAEEASQQIKVD